MHVCNIDNFFIDWYTCYTNFIIIMLTYVYYCTFKYTELEVGKI